MRDKDSKWIISEETSLVTSEQKQQLEEVLKGRLTRLELFRYGGLAGVSLSALGVLACEKAAPAPTPTKAPVVVVPTPTKAPEAPTATATPAMPSPTPTTIDVSKLAENIRWLGHDTFIVGGQLVIYTDPYKLKKDEPKADLILITHDHADHCSPEDVRRIQKAGTTIVTIAACQTKLSGDIKVVKPGDKITVQGVVIEAVPAYNINKFLSPGVPYHPKEAGMVGFVFTANGLRYYHAGDTDNIPEIAGLAPDVAFIPVSGTYVMTVDEAVEAAKAIRPKLAIPMHYGDIVGTPEDSTSFKAKATVPVVVLKAE